MRALVIALILIVASSGAATAFKLKDLVKNKELEQAIVPASGNAAADSVPLTGKLSDSEEEALGREIAGRLVNASPLVADEKLQQYVNRVGVYVAQQSGRPALRWTFGVIQDEAINAFAAPGGYVFVTSGLYRQLENEAELAGVLAHEIAHVNERHHVKLLQKGRLLELGKKVALGAVGNDTVQGLAGNGVEIYARSLDKDAEYACDRLAVEYAARAGYDPFAYVALLDRLGSGESNDQLALLYKTHPHPSERLDALQKLIAGKWDALAPGVVPARLIPLAPPQS